MRWDRLISLLVVIGNAVLGACASQVLTNRFQAAALAICLSIPGLLIIWNRESIGESGFSRGVFRPSPPGLIGAFGWLFLIGLPLLFMLRFT